MTTHTVKLAMVTIDTDDAVGLSNWWRDAFGATVLEENDGWFVVLSLGDGAPLLAFQKVDDPTPGKNRIHLDLITEDRTAMVQQLVDAGATLIAEREMPGMSWVTLADPAGNEFCVAAAADH